MSHLAGMTPGRWRSMVADGWQSRVPENPLTWLPKYVRYPEGWETPRFDFDDAPHVRGLIERFVMDPTKRKANLCWATRLAKTTTLEALAMWKAVEDPVPMVIMYPDNDSLLAIDEHLYPVFERCEPVAAQLPPEYQRNTISIRLTNCSIRLASGGKKSSVSGFPAQWIMKFEHDKTSKRKSTEADASLRLDSRASGFVRGVKIMEEGTPEEKHASRVSKLIDSPDVQQVHYWVQCPHCRKYQTLHHDQIEWDKAASGKSEVALAERTAWYRCIHKGCRIEDHHRPEMMRSGKWLIEGERIDSKGKVSGKPKVDSATMVFGPLSKLYSLLIKGWGSIATEMVAARHAAAVGNMEPMKKLYSETFAIPWDPMRKAVRVNELAERLRCDDHQERGVLPDWTNFLTLTADVGKIAEELIFYWMVIAWGHIARGAVTDWGVSTGVSELLEFWKSAAYSLGGVHVPLWGQPAGIDSGKYSTEIYQLTRSIKNCFPTKGDTKSKSIDLYWPGYQRAGLTPRELELKRKANAYDLLYFNSNMTQEWRVSLVEGRLTPDQPGFVSLPTDVCDSWELHEDFLQELTADQQVGGKWLGENNEYGDTLRYGRGLAECVTQNGKKWGKLRPMSQLAQSGPKMFVREKPGAVSAPFVKGWQ
ncbi:MAG: phage terminase large subunit family protein [Planctomyces sp.]|nr:phage terminase large subunit family protein [Planctomyces sp.]